jgi:hypothetical protein
LERKQLAQLPVDDLRPAHRLDASEGPTRREVRLAGGSVLIGKNGRGRAHEAEQLLYDAVDVDRERDTAVQDDREAHLALRIERGG